MTDKQILDLYFARNENAIAQTAQSYGGMIRSIAYNILKNIADCEECENDTYLAAWNKIPPHIPNCLPAFLGRITRNLALDRFDYCNAQKRNREFEVILSELGDMLSDKQSPEHQYDVKETADTISTFLRSKSHAKRVVFIRRYYYCDPIRKIAEDYGFSESKVKSMLLRMRNELKKYLERNEIYL